MKIEKNKNDNKHNMKIEKVSVKDVILNPKNPRTIKDDKFKKLVKSIKEFPEMLEVRPIVVDDDMVILGGNMRFKACKEAGLKEISIIKFSNLPEEKKNEFIVKDNIGFGEWDWEMLNKEWDADLLLRSGFEEWELEPSEEEKQNYRDKLENSDEKPVDIDVNDYIKQNIFFFNEFMVEFEDDIVKTAVRNLNDISSKEQFIEDIKNLIIRYGKNSI
jgi:hypothetical protein